MQNRSLPPLRRDFARQKHFLKDDRPPDRLIAHYVLERELSQRLRCSSRDARSRAYAEVYRELFASLPDHPQKRSKPDGGSRVTAQLDQIVRYVGPQSVFLELGCGDAAVGFAAATHVGTVCGLDVTDALINFAAAPPNFRYVHTEGVEIPLPTAGVDFAYSNQLLEHLHPEDAADQLREVYRVLRPGGRYLCITPSRVTGPHDISGYFDYEATGLHLREYDYGDLLMLFREAGFQDFSCFASIRGYEIRLPYSAIRVLERTLLSLPADIRSRATRLNILQRTLGLNVLVTK